MANSILVKGREKMTLQQQALNVITNLPDEKLSLVLQFAEFLAEKSKGAVLVKREPEDDSGYIRKPGILKRKMVMSEDFDETPECFKEYI